MKNTKPVINIRELVPEKWTVENFDDNQIKVYYINKGRGNSPKPFILPKEVVVDREFIEAVGMYLGDGKLSKDDKHLGFSSIDMDMSQFILNFFLSRFGISLSDMTISIRFKEFNGVKFLQWSKALNVPVEKLKRQTTLRSRNESCEMQISGKIFRILFEKILNETISSNFLQNKELRRAFLRGLFAAEGNIALNRKRNYIVCMQYCLGKHEKKLASLITQALSLEDIDYRRFNGESDNSLTIRLTGWRNYYKCWKMDLFSLNLRKEFLFLNKLKVTKFSCNFSEDMLKKLFIVKHFSDRQLAFLVGAHPFVFPNALQNKSPFVNIEYIIKLCKVSAVSLNEVKDKIIEFRVNDVTPIRDKEFIDFIFDLKLFA